MTEISNEELTKFLIERYYNTILMTSVFGMLNSVEQYKNNPVLITFNNTKYGSYSTSYMYDKTTNRFTIQVESHDNFPGKSYQLIIDFNNNEFYMVEINTKTREIKDIIEKIDPEYKEIIELLVNATSEDLTNTFNEIAENIRTLLEEKTTYDYITNKEIDGNIIYAHYLYAGITMSIPQIIALGNTLFITSTILNKKTEPAIIIGYGTDKYNNETLNIMNLWNGTNISISNKRIIFSDDILIHDYNYVDEIYRLLDADTGEGIMIKPLTKEFTKIQPDFIRYNIETLKEHFNNFITYGRNENFPLSFIYNTLFLIKSVYMMPYIVSGIILSETLEE